MALSVIECVRIADCSGRRVESKLWAVLVALIRPELATWVPGVSVGVSAPCALAGSSKHADNHAADGVLKVPEPDAVNELTGGIVGVADRHGDVDRCRIEVDQRSLNLVRIFCPRMAFEMLNGPLTDTPATVWLGAGCWVLHPGRKPGRRRKKVCAVDVGGELGVA